MPEELAHNPLAHSSVLPIHAVCQDGAAKQVFAKISSSFQVYASSFNVFPFEEIVRGVKLQGFNAPQ